MHQRFVRTAGIGLLVALAWSGASAQDASPEALQTLVYEIGKDPRFAF